MVSIGLGDRRIVGSSLFRPFFLSFFWGTKGLFDWRGDLSEFEFESIVEGGEGGCVYVVGHCTS